MDDLERVARLARELCALRLQGDQLDLRERVLALGEVLPRLWLAGGVLPVVPEVPQPPPGPGAEGWPGLGRFDASEPRLATALDEVEAWLWSGLQYWDDGDPAGALTVWAGGYVRWSTALVAVLPALHDAVLRFRPEPQLDRRDPAEPSLVMVGSGRGDPPAGVVPAPPPAVKPALGVRFEAIGLGAYVCEVHPRSPAAGAVQAGDVVLSVDGVSLEHVDPGVLAERMVGPVGEERAYVVYRDGEAREVRFASVGIDALRGEAGD